MRILCAGGGSGGHVTPVAAVINEIIRDEPYNQIWFVCDKAFEVQARGLMERTVKVPVSVHTITAGKFRRYHHISVLRQLMMPQIVFANLVDVFKVVAGFVQSVVLMWQIRPDVVFAKGGYVCLPVGMAAKVLRIPLVIHDSDARPGLTNSILSRWATAIGTGSPLENYSYDKNISKYVGVPIGESFRPYDVKKQRAAKKKLGFGAVEPLVVVTGGGLGAESINTAMLQISERLIKEKVNIYHVTGRKHFEDVYALAHKDERYVVVPFVFENMHDVLGAADVVVARGSATFTQELAGLAKPVIMIPAHTLGDQRKNAEVFGRSEAVLVLTDRDIEDPKVLYDAISGLLENTHRRDKLSSNLHEFAKPHAAREVARMILDAAAK